MQYTEECAEIAKQVLSKAFKSKQDACIAIGITTQVFEEWLGDYEDFEQAVAEGFLAGEVAARKWLKKAALLPSKAIDLKIYWGFAEDIYGIGKNDDVADNTEPVRWNINIHHVRPESEHTNEVGTVSD